MEGYRVSSSYRHKNEVILINTFDTKYRIICHYDVFHKSTLYVIEEVPIDFELDIINGSQELSMNTMKRILKYIIQLYYTSVENNVLFEEEHIYFSDGGYEYDIKTDKIIDDINDFIYDL